METLTKQFESRVTGFLERTGLKPSMFGLRAEGDPNLMRQLHLGRPRSSWPTGFWPSWTPTTRAMRIAFHPGAAR